MNKWKIVIILALKNKQFFTLTFDLFYNLPELKKRIHLSNLVNNKDG